MALLLKHQTVEELVSRIRTLWRDGTPQDRVKIARAVISRLQAGDFTDAQFRVAFSLNASQWNTLKTKMNNLISASNTVEYSTGE